MVLVQLVVNNMDEKRKQILRDIAELESTLHGKQGVISIRETWSNGTIYIHFNVFSKPSPFFVSELNNIVSNNLKHVKNVVVSVEPSTIWKNSLCILCGKLNWFYKDERMRKHKRIDSIRNIVPHTLPGSVPEPSDKSVTAAKTGNGIWSKRVRNKLNRRNQH